MRKALAYIFILASLMVSCRRERLDPVVVPDGQPSFRLSVSVSGGDAETKGTVTNPGGEVGETDMNENVIRSLDFFFFPKGSEGGNANPLNHVFIADAGNKNLKWEWTKAITQSTEDQAFLKSLFGNALANGSECEAYVIVNLWEMSGSDKVSKFASNWSTQTHATLRSTIIETSNSNGFNLVVSGEAQKEEQFIMEGSNLITLSIRNGRHFVEGEIPVYRSAAKIRLQVTVPNDIIENGVLDPAGFKWDPVVSEMKTVFVRGVHKGYVCAYDELYKYEESTSFNASTDVFPLGSEDDMWTNYGHAMTYRSETSWTEEDPTTHTNVTKTGKVYEHDVPFYSYRTKNWKGSENAANEAYLILMLPWKRETKPGSESVPYNYTPTYYQIPIAQDHTAQKYYLKSNRYYRQEVTVSILGSFHIEDLVQLDPNTFIILDWNTQDMADPTVSNVTMSHTSFMAVSNNTVEMNNVSSASVEYNSSHTVSAEFTKLEFYSYYDTGSTDRYLKVVYTRNRNSSGVLQNSWTRTVYNKQEMDYNGTTENNAIITGNNYGSTNITSNPLTSATGTNNAYKGFPLGGYSLSTANGKITLNHEIPSSQFSKAIITVEVTNSAITTPEIITFTQYPSIYIDAQRSNGYVFVNGKGQGNNQIVAVYDDRNNNNGVIGSLSPRNSVSGGGGTNDNRNLYTIHISSFAAGTSYILGDPRTYEAVSLANLSGTNNSYHPTRSLYTATYGQDDTENMISPEFLIASSYGAVNGSYYMSYDQAKKRCAAYQESGYPAGRWRMPTKAEVLYMMDLSRNTKIPSLFYFTGNNDSEGYWCANGKVVTSGGKLQLANNSTKTAVRCVYDVWYWGSEPYNGTHSTTWLGYKY